MVVKRIKESKSIREATDDLSYEEHMNNMKSNDTFKMMSDICDKYGYKLINAYREERSSGIVGEVIIRRGSDRYTPDIFTQWDRSSQKISYKIQTASYGSLTIDEYPQFLKCVQNAYDCVNELSEVNLNNLYTVKEDIL